MIDELMKLITLFALVSAFDLFLYGLEVYT